MTKSKFHIELTKQKKEVLKMGELVRNMLDNSVNAMKNQDIKLANEVISKQNLL